MALIEINIGKKKKQNELDELFNSKPDLGSVDTDYGIFDEIKLESTLEAKSVSKIVGELRKDTRDRKRRYELYKEAAQNPIIGQAIEIMADDATQFDVSREKTVWVESPDKKYENAINGIILDYIEPFIDTVASSIIAKGEFAFKVKKGKEKSRDGFKDVELFPYKHIEKLHHLILEDQEHVFYVVDEISNVTLSQQAVDNFQEYDKFLHFINYSLENSTEVKVEKKRKGEKIETADVFILQGESIIS